MTKRARTSSESATPSPEALVAALEEGLELPEQISPTALALESALTGEVEALPSSDDQPLHGEELLLAGDPDVDPLDSEYTGDDIPGGSTPTPDQNDVDAIGRAYGLAEDLSEEVTSTEARVTRRDRHRWELDPRSKDAQP